MQALFIHLTSSDGKRVYFPINRLLRIESLPETGTVLVSFEGFQIRIKTEAGSETEVADSFYRDLNNFSHECVYLNPKSKHVTEINFSAGE